jgi:hypothetical protein
LANRASGVLPSQQWAVVEAVQALGVTEADLPPLANGIRRDEDQPGAGAGGLGAADLRLSDVYIHNPAMIPLRSLLDRTINFNQPAHLRAPRF